MNNSLEMISSVNLVRYLTLRGWNCSPLLDGRVTQCITPDDFDSVLLPNDKSFSDYEESLRKALYVISNWEGISVKHLYNKLANPSCDLLRWRIADDNTLRGTIPLNSLSSNIDYIKDMLGAACLDILSPAPYHQRIFTKDVLEQISNYKFGQTDIGSYILNLFCPLGYYQYKLFDISIEDLPIPRQVNLKILDTINLVQKAAQDNSSEMSDTVGSGKISVNFLNALTEIYEENKDSEVSISADWNRDVPLLKDKQVSKVVLNPLCFEKVMAVVEEYTPKQLQNVFAIFYGKITNVGTEAEINNRQVVDIKVATIGDNFRTIIVNATLNYSDYFEIVQKAFQNGLDVKLSGTKTTTARNIKLSDASIEIAY